jgi:hypothetical protein
LKSGIGVDELPLEVKSVEFMKSRIGVEESQLL